MPRKRKCGSGKYVLVQRPLACSWTVSVSKCASRLVSGKAALLSLPCSCYTPRSCSWGFPLWSWVGTNSSWWWLTKQMLFFTKFLKEKEALMKMSFLVYTRMRMCRLLFSESPWDLNVLAVQKNFTAKSWCVMKFSVPHTDLWSMPCKGWDSWTSQITTTVSVERNSKQNPTPNPILTFPFFKLHWKAFIV